MSQLETNVLDVTKQFLLHLQPRDQQAVPRQETGELFSVAVSTAKSICFKFKSMEAGVSSELMGVLVVQHESLTTLSCISFCTH